MKKIRLSISTLVFILLGRLGQSCSHPIKRTRSFHALFAILVASFAARGMVPVNLYCENSVKPMGVEAAAPRLSWQLQAKGNERSKSQTAYRILVASSPEKLAANTGDLWDSGKIKSDESLGIPYAGKALSSTLQVFWKVRTWDESHKVGEWSAPSEWTMGFLKDTDWKATWVGPANKNERDSVNRYAALQFRKEVTLKKKPVKAIARFCGLGFGELYINGEKISNDKMAPGWTDYTKTVYYMTYDVTNQMQQGENAFGVLLGNGWYNLPTPDLFKYEKAPWKSHPKFLLNIALTYNDGTAIKIVSDDTWKWRNSHIIFNCVRGGETIDARLIQQDWNKAFFDDKQWNNSAIVMPPSGRLTPQAIPAEQVTQVIKPVKLTEPKPGIYVYDLGTHIAGWVQFKAFGNKGQMITLDFDENLNEDGTITVKSLNSHTHGRYQAGELILSGKDSDLFEPSFTYHGFRYIQVKGLLSKPKPNDLIACMVHNNVSSSGSFECSKELLNKVHNAFMFAVNNSLHSVYTEPAREKITWTQDAHNIMEGAIFNFDFYTFSNKLLNDVIDSQEPNGHVPPINPVANWGFSKPNGMPPDWSDPWWGGVILEIPWFIYTYYGDREVLRRAYEPMKRFVDYLGTTAVDSVFIDWWLGDWCEAKTLGRPVRTPIIQTSTTGYFYYCSLLGKIAAVLNRNEDSKRYNHLAEKIKTAYNKRFLDYKTGLYTDDSQTAQIMPLYLGLSPVEKNELILKRLLENIKQWEGHLSSGFVGYLYLLNGLSHFGYSDVAYEMAIKEDSPGWGIMVKNGGTTLWEAWSGNAYNFGSLGGVDSWYYKTLAGINPVEEFSGFKKIVISPEVVGDLSWVKARYNSPYGKIGSSWKTKNDSLFMEIIIPVNTTASVYIPSENINEISESGKPVFNSDGIKFDQMEKDKIVLSLGSGTYNFAIPFTKREVISKF